MRICFPRWFLSLEFKSGSFVFEDNDLTSKELRVRNSRCKFVDDFEPEMFPNPKDPLHHVNHPPLY
jgi:hypothetical protein